jgi:polysaccharide deacetylase family protein (PEP-CTERM system associated)
VEDNFTYEELCNKADWDRYESQVVENTLRILKILRDHGAGATFFVVGHVAQRHPELIKFIVEDGHEVASHSCSHLPLQNMPWDQIENDIRTSRQVLSSLVGSPVLGFRAMGFSVPRDIARFYELLKKYGYKYDSSRRRSDSLGCMTVRDEPMKQVYPSALELIGRDVVFSGGTFFRLMPMSLVLNGFARYERSSQPVMLYLHPWEFNRDQPKRKVPLLQRVLQSRLTFSAERKLIALLGRYRFTSVREFLRI